MAIGKNMVRGFFGSAFVGACVLTAYDLLLKNKVSSENRDSVTVAVIAVVVCGVAIATGVGRILDNRAAARLGIFTTHDTDDPLLALTNTADRATRHVPSGHTY